MRKHRLLWQLIPSYLIVIIASLALVVLFARGALRDFYYDRTEADLIARASIFEELIALNSTFDSDPLHGSIEQRIERITEKIGQRTNTRITIIFPNGKVAVDSDESPETMDNHADRPEIVDAMQGKTGRAVRYSRTLDKDMMYVAIPIKEDGKITAVLRTSISVSDIDQQIGAIDKRILIGGLVIALLAAATGLIVSRRISKPLESIKKGAERFASGDLSKRLPTCSTIEIAALADTMNQMADELDARLIEMERQKNEREAILSSMAEGVLALDSKWHLIGLNRAAAELLEIDESDIENRTLQELVRNAQLEELLGEVYAEGRSVEGDITVYHPDPRHFHVHGTVLRDPAISGSEPEEIGVLVVLHDVTRLKRLENIRRDFVANVSHELKTPVTSIKGFVETLLDGGRHDPDDVSRFLRIVAAQAERLHAIIEDLLLLSRIEQEPREDDNLMEPALIKGVIDSAVEVCSLGITEKKIDVEVVCDNQLRAEVNAPLLVQAVVNLLDNAIKYSPPESAVSIRATHEQGETIICVKDHGCGIGHEHLPRLFERFYRVDKARSREVGGTGLGLAIVKHIAQLHGGRASVDSRPAEGSTFSLHLPDPG